MHLRFPLPAGYFPKFELTPHETMAFQSLVSDIVKETRRNQLRHLKDGKMSIDSRTWKLAKSKERLHVYRKRSMSQEKLGLYGAAESMSSSLSRSGSESSQDGYPHSGRRGVPTRTSAAASVTSSGGSASFDHESFASMTISGRTDEDGSRKSIESSVLGFGLIEGTIDDVVYGLHEASTDEMKTIASFLGDDSLIDCAVLHTLRVTKSTYLGLKWKLTRSLGGNRDVCYIESVGIAVDPSGERYGYHVLESVPVGNCPPFADNSIVRTNMSFCYLFRESAQAGLVDVFMEGAFDSSADALTAGGVGDNRSAMEMLFGLTRAFDAAEAKKLSALVAKQATQPAVKASGSHCSICRAKPGLLSSHLVCQGCGCVICTKCRVKKQTFSRKGRVKVSCCKICLVNVKDTSPFEGVTFDKQPLTALKKKPDAPRAPPPPQAAPPQPVMPASDGHNPKLLRHNSSNSVTDTEYSQSMQSWPSSSVSSSTYSDIDDTSYYPTLQQTPEHGSSQLVVMDRKMPAVVEAPGYGYHHHHHHHQSQQQLARYGSQHQITAPSQHQMHYLPPTQHQSQPQHYPSHLAPHHHHQGGYAPQQQHQVPLPRSSAGNQSRAGLYNQMLELQMAAERAYNMANQNATLLQQQQQR